MKKFFIVLLIVILVMPVFSTNASAASIKLNKSKKTIYVGDTLKLKLKNAPSNAKITWKSSNTSIATVNDSGKVTAKKKGTATITAKYNNKSYECKISVKKPKGLNAIIRRLQKNDRIIEKNVYGYDLPISQIDKTLGDGFISVYYLKDSDTILFGFTDNYAVSGIYLYPSIKNRIGIALTTSDYDGTGVFDIDTLTIDKIHLDYEFSSTFSDYTNDTTKRMFIEMYDEIAQKYARVLCHIMYLEASAAGTSLKDLGFKKLKYK